MGPLGELPLVEQLHPNENSYLADPARARAPREDEPKPREAALDIPADPRRPCGAA